jgi:hypothetical protein
MATLGSDNGRDWSLTWDGSKVPKRTPKPQPLQIQEADSRPVIGPVYECHDRRHWRLEGSSQNMEGARSTLHWEVGFDLAGTLDAA